jgi:2-polyprenyl-3-methyl-5-hydroxy-6-metoxy-1,4-benzoquinol methylase
VEEGTVVPRPFATHSNYIFERNLDDRQRLARQFRLLREDFDLWFDEALRLGGLSTDEAEAAWSALDMGCGEGQYTREIARRYPLASVLGTDVDAAAIAAASRAAGATRNVRFLVHDAREALPEAVLRGTGLDVVVLWMVLLYLPDKQAVLHRLAAALKPGGVLLLGYIPDPALRLNHPSAAAIMAAADEMVRRSGMVELETNLGEYLRAAGFVDATTALLRYLVGAGTSGGQRWFGYALDSLAAGRHFLVDVGRTMEGADYDRHLERLASAPVLSIDGEVRFLVTVARRAASSPHVR